MLKLVVKDINASEPTLPISWCISSDVVQKLEAREAAHPHVLLLVASITPHWNYTNEEEKVEYFKEDTRMRQLVPLKNMMEYITFKLPGRYRILATIVWASDAGKIASLRNDYLGARSYTESDLVTVTGELRPDIFCPETCLETASVDVTVSQEFFAHQPAEWKKDWVNLFFNHSAQDQCQFRRRCIFAFTLQPFIVAAFMLASTFLKFVIALAALSVGVRRIHFGMLLEPFTMPKTMRARIVWRDSVFLVDERMRSRPFFLRFAMPAMVLGIAALHVVYQVWLRHLTWQLVLVGMGKTYVFIAALTLGIYGWRLIKRRMYKKPIKTQEELDLDAWEARQKLLKKQREEELLALQPLLCTVAPKEPDLEALPKDRRSIHLRYMHLKSKVCRPFYG